MNDTKPAAANGGSREIIITNWRPYSKNSLVGFFSATFSNGLILHGLMLHQHGAARWIGYPAREWKDPQGNTKYARFITFRDHDSADGFRDALLASLDRYFGAQQ